MQTHKQRTKNNQINGSNTEATLILCGYSGERANRGDSTIKEEVRRRKMRKFADKQSSKQRTIKEEARRRKMRKFADKQSSKQLTTRDKG